MPKNKCSLKKHKEIRLFVYDILEELEKKIDLDPDVLADATSKRVLASKYADKYCKRK